MSENEQHSGPYDDDFWPSASWQTLALRGQLLQKIRDFFHLRGFLEVETPLLSADVVVDRHLDPLVTTLCVDPRQPQLGRSLYLQTSPEFAMKRLLAAGAPAIYQITRAFRNSECGPRHNPEFTIVEWYRPADDLAAGIDLLAELAMDVMNLQQVPSCSYADAFLRYAEVHPHLATADQLLAACRRLKIDVPVSFSPTDRDGLLDLLLTGVVEPQLTALGAVILFDYPAGQAALAKLRRVERPAPHDVAERFELYVDGVELANGYHELLDPAVLRERNRRGNLQRATDGKPTLPEESRLLAAMEHGLPACSGVALGFDRLVMVMAGAKHIRDVMPFTIDRA